MDSVASADDSGDFKVSVLMSQQHSGILTLWRFQVLFFLVLGLLGVLLRTDSLLLSISYRCGFLDTGWMVLPVIGSNRQGEGERSIRLRARARVGEVVPQTITEGVTVLDLLTTTVHCFLI